jgi:hypothetical protein
MRDQVILHRVKDDLLHLGHLLFRFCQQHMIGRLYNLVINEVPQSMLLQQHQYPTLPQDKVRVTFQSVSYMRLNVVMQLLLEQPAR